MASILVEEFARSLIAYDRVGAHAVSLPLMDPAIGPQSGSFHCGLTRFPGSVSTLLMGIAA